MRVSPLIFSADEIRPALLRLDLLPRGRWRRLFLVEEGWSVTAAGERKPDFTALADEGWE
jgi:hypothetical protein